MKRLTICKSGIRAESPYKVYIYLNINGVNFSSSYDIPYFHAVAVHVTITPPPSAPQFRLIDSMNFGADCFDKKHQQCFDDRLAGRWTRVKWPGTGEDNCNRKNIVEMLITVKNSQCMASICNKENKRIKKTII